MVQHTEQIVEQEHEGELLCALDPSEAGEVVAVVLAGEEQRASRWERVVSFGRSRAGFRLQGGTQPAAKQADLHDERMAPQGRLGFASSLRPGRGGRGGQRVLR